jgi:nicotinamidase-related amidase
MQKDRLKDTFDYLKARAKANHLAGVGVPAIEGLRRKVAEADLTNGGNALSLGWTRFDYSRPDQDTRHAIRAYLLVSIYNGDINATNTAAAASNVKTRGVQWLHKKIAKGIKRCLGKNGDPINTNACVYELRAPGRGTKRASAVYSQLDRSVEDELLRRVNKSQKVAVVLIDMQASSDVGEYRSYGGKTILEHQQAVLEVARENDVVIYDIVIDAIGAHEFGNAYTLKNLGGEAKEKILERQRRNSYGEKAGIQTIPELSKYFRGGKGVRHIPKPSHPTFLGTLFAEHLEEDGIKSVVIMGFDANQCIKATVFGVPSETREEAEREPKANEVEAVLRQNPKLTLEQAQKQATPTKAVTTPYIPGLLDKGIKVITSRAVMASSYMALDDEWGKLARLP